MKYSIKKTNGTTIVKEVDPNDKVRIARLEKNKWKKVEEKAAPKEKKETK